MNKTVIIGGGAWGCALGSAVLEKKTTPFILTSSPKRANDINNGKSSRFDDNDIQLKLKAGTKPKDILEGASVVILATEVDRVLSFIKEIKDFTNKNCAILIASKGFGNRGEIIPLILKEKLKNDNIGVISGPSFAYEVIKKKPTALVVAGNKDIIKLTTDLFHSNKLRIYGSEDIIGTSISGAMKNVIAIASGIVYGLNLGENARAAILTRGLAETARLVEGLGGNFETVFGLAGIGDMALSSLSMTSRNFAWGYSLAKKLPFKNNLVEGLKASKMAIMNAEKLNLEMPITRFVTVTNQDNLDLKIEVEKMLNRPPKLEWIK